ncbi:hypothetical protein ACFX2C_027730 [Malus domestica]
MEHTDIQAYVEKDAKYIAKLLKDVIKEVGLSNVVHIVTDNGLAFVKAGEIMMERYPIYWTPCAAHCIDLIFEDIGKQESVANVVPTMPILYDMFHIMKKKISKLKGKKWILKIINHRWDVTLSRPLHQVGVGHNKELLSGLQRVFERLNPIGAEKIDPPAEWWNLHGDSTLSLQKIAMCILSQTASSSACERNWSTFALIHTKQRNRLTYTRLEKIVFCYYNMKLKLRDEEAEMNKVAENDYIDLLNIAGQPSDDDNNPIEQRIMTAHLDDEQGNPDTVIAQHAAQGVNVDRIIFEDVKSGDTSSFERDMLGTRQGQRRRLRDDASTSRKESSSNSSDNDGGSNAGSGGNEEGRQYSPFTIEADFTHATQDEDHGCREAGLGIGAIRKQYLGKRS